MSAEQIVFKRDMWDGEIPICPRCGGETYIIFGTSIIDKKIKYLINLVCKREGINFKFDVIESMVKWIKDIENKAKTLIVKNSSTEFVRLTNKDNLFQLITEEDKNHIQVDKLNVLSEPNWSCDLIDINSIIFNTETKELIFVLDE